MSCVTSVVGTSGRVITTQSTQVTQQQSTVSHPGGVSSVIYTTCVPVTVKNESTCEPSTGTRTMDVPGKVETTLVQVTLTVDGYITEYNTVYSTSCNSSPPPYTGTTTTTTSSTTITTTSDSTSSTTTTMTTTPVPTASTTTTTQPSTTPLPTTTTTTPVPTTSTTTTTPQPSTTPLPSTTTTTTPVPTTSTTTTTPQPSTTPLPSTTTVTTTSIPDPTTSTTTTTPQPLTTPLPSTTTVTTTSTPDPTTSTTTTTPQPSTTPLPGTTTVTTTSTPDPTTSTITTTLPPSTTPLPTTTSPQPTTPSSPPPTSLSSTTPDPLPTTTTPSSYPSPTPSTSSNPSTVTSTLLSISVSRALNSGTLTPGTMYPFANVTDSIVRGNDPPVGPIIGGVLGGLVGVVLLGIVIYYIILSKSAQGGRAFPSQRNLLGGDEELHVHSDGMLYNQTFSLQEWSGNHLYSSLNNTQGQLPQMQNTESLQNIAAQDQGMQQSQQPGQTQYPPIQEHTQTHGQGVHYTQVDSGQHALQGGESHLMQGQGAQHPQPDAGQQALHGGESQYPQGIHQVQITGGISEMAQERLAVAPTSTGALGASVGGYTAATGKHQLVLSPSGSSASASAVTYPQGESPSQTPHPSTITPFILSTLRPDDPSPSPSQLSSPSSASIVPFILSPLRHEEPLPQYASTNYAEPLKPSAAQRSNRTDSPIV